MMIGAGSGANLTQINNFISLLTTGNW